MNRIAFIAFSTLATTLAFAGLALIGGCSSPHPHAAPATAKAEPEHTKPPGSLKVFTAQGWENADDGPLSWVHSEYKILGADGRLFMQVQNGSRSNNGEAEVVTMPVGNYVVIAQARGRGRVSVPVKIESGRMTVLHLDQAADGSAPKKK